MLYTNKSIYYLDGNTEMFDSIKKWFKKPTPSAKETATAKGEPYINVLTVDVDPKSPRTGSFELDWNQHFITLLRKTGYQGMTDEQVVDQWFQDVCRHVVLETFEQEQANVESKGFVTRRKTADGRSEIG